MYALTKRSLFDLGRELPDYYGHEDPLSTSEAMIKQKEKLRRDTREKFFNMDLFFVKVSLSPKH